jgi:hypothetical protein
MLEPAPPLLKKGETVTAAHFNALSAAVAARTPAQGRGVRNRRLPWGTVVNYDASAGSFSPPTFAPSVARTAAGARVSFARGLIAGIEPTIGGVAISAKSKPSLFITDWNAQREAYVYFRMKFAADWGIESIEAVATAEVPVPKPREAWKLALIVFQDGGHWRALHSNQGHLATARRASGEALHLFWSQL